MIFHNQSAKKNLEKSGFILPAVLAVLAMIGLVTIGALLALRSATDAVVSAKAMANLDRAAATAEARVAFLLATQPIGMAGFRVNGARISLAQEEGYAPFQFSVTDAQFIGTPLKADGRPYRLESGQTMPTPVMVELQDTGGLLNLNAAGAPGLARLLTNLGASAGDARRLAAKAADFTDTDNDVRFEGAEGNDYRRQGQRSPPNKSVIRIQDMYRIPGWLPQGVNITRFEELVTTTIPRDTNINVAPREVLQAVFNINANQAAAAIRARENAPFQSIQQFQSAVSGSVDSSDEAIYTFSGQTYRLRIQAQSGGPILERLLEMAPRNTLRPIWVNDRRQFPPKAALSQEQTGRVIAALPSPTGLDPAR